MSSSPAGYQWSVFEAEARFELALGLATDTPIYKPPAFDFTITNYPNRATKSSPRSQQFEEGPAQAWMTRFGARNVYTVEDGLEVQEMSDLSLLYAPASVAQIAQDTAPLFPASRENNLSTVIRKPMPRAQIPNDIQCRSPRRPPSMIGDLLLRNDLYRPEVRSTNVGTQQGHRTQAIILPMLGSTLAQPLLPMPPSAASFLQVLNGRKGSSNATGTPFANFQKDRPPYNVQPPLGVDIGMREICVFLPDWLHIIEVVVRLTRNGANRALLAKMQLLATRELTKENFIRCKNKIQQQIGESGRRHYGNESWNISLAREQGPQDDLTASSWTTHRKGKIVKFEHIKLVDIYSAVRVDNFPTGRDRLLFTQCLEFARNNSQLDLDTSHLEWIIGSQGLQAPLAPIGQNRDQESVKAFDEPNP